MFDLLTLSIGIGLVVSLLFSETLGRSAGGLIVPGYLAFHITRPLNIAVTLAAALATYAVVYVLSNYLIIYGRRRTVAMIVTGFFIGGLVGSLLGIWVPSDGGAGLAVIGYIIPGLIAIWFDRQGLLDTCSALFTATAVTRLVLILFATSQLQIWELEHQPVEPPQAQTSTDAKIAEVPR